MTVEEWKTQVLQKYIDENDPPIVEIENIFDYLRSNEISLSVRIDYETMKTRSEEWILLLNEKNKNITDSGEVKVIQQFKNGLKFVHLIDQASKDWEGVKMRHCVASYKTHTGIYSLRDKDNIPHCTIELNNEDGFNLVRQIKGKANGKIAPKYVESVVAALTEMNIVVSTKDLGNLGYVRLFDRELNILNSNFKGMKYLTFGVDKYLYTGNKFQLIKPFTEQSTNLLNLLIKNRSSLDGVKMLIENGTPFLHNEVIFFRSACRNGNLDFIKFLVENDGNLNLAIQKGILLIAAESGKKDIVNYLLNKATISSDLLSSCLEKIEDRANPEIVKILLEHGGKFSSKYLSPQLRKSIYLKDLEGIKAAIKDNPRTVFPNWNASYLAWKTSPEVFEVIIDHEISINPKRLEKLFILASIKNEQEKIDFILKKFGNTSQNLGYLLIGAVTSQNYSRAENLIKQGANPNIDGKSLLAAVDIKNLAFIKLLIESGADPSFNEYQALKESVRSGNLEILNLLKENTPGNASEQAFIQAIKSAKIDVVNFFIQEGLDIHFKNNLAFREAKINQVPEITKLLSKQSLYSYFISLWI